MTTIGELSLWVALLMAAWSTIVSYAGGALHREDLVESGTRALYATCAMIALASIGLWTALVSRDFSLDYVAGHVGQFTPGVYTFTAFWSGEAGSALLSALFISIYGTVAIASRRSLNRELVPWVAGTVSAILLFLVATTCFAANPFVRVDVTPLDGRGMDPRLQNAAVALYQPSLYLGYAATALSFAYVIAALLTRRLDTRWLGGVRRSTMLAWFFLTIGIVLGMRSSYVEPESMRRGYWAWLDEPSILAWLAVTLSLHSNAAQAKRGSFRKWNVILVCASFLLSVFAAFVTRGGVAESAPPPSSAQSPTGTWFSAFFFLTAGITVYLVGTRLRDLEATVEATGSVSNRRRYGGYVVHAGFVVLLAAFAALPFRRQYEARLRTGESYQATDTFGHVWRFVSQGVSQFDRADHVVAVLALDTYRDSKRVGLITSERRTYRDIQGNQLFEPSIRVGIHSTALLDTYVVPADLRREKGSDIADLRIAFNPLIVWIWAGGAVMALGGLIVTWPRAEQRSAVPGYVAS